MKGCEARPPGGWLTNSNNNNTNLKNTPSGKTSGSGNITSGNSSSGGGGVQTSGNQQGLPRQMENFNPNRNPAQDKKVPDSVIKKLEKYLGEDIHGIKGKGSSKYDIFNDKEGNLYQKPKGGTGKGDPLDVNLKELSL